MGFTATEIKDFASKATAALSQVRWFHGVTIDFHTNPLCIIKHDIRIVLSEKLMKAFKVTSSTKPSEARKRIEQHMSVKFDGNRLYLNFEGGEGVGTETVKVELKCAIVDIEQDGFANFLKYSLKYGVEAYRGDQGDALRDHGYFGKKD